MSRYALDARTATDHFPGIGRYVSNLAQAMAVRLGRDERLLILIDPRQPSRWRLPEKPRSQVEHVTVHASPFSLRQQWLVPRLLKRYDADVYHSPYYLMPYRPGVPTMLTIHDLIPQLFPRYVSLQARLIFRLTTTLALRCATQVISVSDATRRDLQEYYSLSSQGITTIPEAASPQFQPLPGGAVTEIRRKYRLPESYSLYFGSNKPHKNLTRLVEAWDHLLTVCSRDTMALVIAGQWDERYPEAKRAATRLGLEQNIHFLGPVAEDDLPALYNGATVFVFPSLYEGFGLPVVEAMACGCAVVCADAASLPELAGDAALLVNPREPRAIANAVQALLEDESLRRELRQRALRRAAQFSWSRTGKETLSIYRRLLRTSSGN